MLCSNDLSSGIPALSHTVVLDTEARSNMGIHSQNPDWPILAWNEVLHRLIEVNPSLAGYPGVPMHHLLS